MKDFMYEFIDSGERIFVECEEIEEVPGIMRSWSVEMYELEYIGEYTPSQAEWYGYDTY